MLTSVNRYRPLFDHAGTDAVCTLHLVGPHSAEPSPRIFELACPCTFAVMGDCYARAKQNKTTYPVSQTTFYNWSISWAVKVSLSSG
jgi:hypothetical protein